MTDQQAQVTESQRPMTAKKEFDPPLDKGIMRAVEILVEAGIETFESCEGGNGHAYPEPTIRFYGDKSEGYKAIAIAIQNDLPVQSIRRIWTITEKELIGPYWEIVFSEKVSYLP